MTASTDDNREGDRDEVTAASGEPAADSLPFLVQLIAALLIFGGVGGLVVVNPGEADSFNFFNLALCAVGFGLLRRSRTAWGCTTLFFGVIVIGAIIGLFGAAIPAFRPAFGVENNSLLSAALTGVGVLAVTGTLLFALTRRDVTAKFNDEFPKSRAKSATRWGWIILILGAFSVAADYFVAKENEKLLEGLFPVDTTYRIFDAKTDESIKGIRWQRSGIYAGIVGARLKNTTLSLSAMRLSGYAFEPFEVTISADGYEEKTVTVDEDSPSELRFSLQKTSEKRRPESDQPADSL